ncbi:Aste57867_13316 [Aphanomyces stellatus]|uniref:Aste57867_13316 protein n=1 Tax=Aphanomyces stellatus TaxID=120398 RepID=A0A485KZI0_9STRA|nr:hypothetical protein As57867_013267 [Aphanomyces stellatus]VFT90155.1 Aste57867_13316 [Aphanomyces stellatus]
MSWTKLFGAELQTKEGLKPTEEVLAGKKYVGIYFSAHWCPPCRRFTPLLAESYQQFIDDDLKDLAIVFVSWDEAGDDFDKYYGEMTFDALPFQNREQKEVLDQLYEVNSIPTLVFLNESGEIITKGGRVLVENARGNPTLILGSLAQA